MQKVLNFFSDNDHFARHCGIELLDATPGTAKAKMVIQPFHLNGAGTVHGGAIFSLADFTFAVAANNHGQLSLAINTSTTFIKAAREGILYAEAEELSVNRRLGNYQVRISDENNNLIATFQGTAYRKDERLFES
jgi:acyl-CoA thioesterase